VDFRLLGRLEARADGVDVAPARAQRRALLAFLLLRADQAVSTHELVEGLWDGRPPATAQTALQGHVSALRKAVGAERIETEPPGYRLRLLEGDELDLRRVDAVAAVAGSGDRLARLQDLREAIALFRGEPLAEFRYHAFAAEESARLEALRLALEEERVELELQYGRYEEAVPELERLIAENPFREDLRAQLMLALYRAGRQADALRAYQEARGVMVDELGIDPSPALRRLERQILEQDPELAPSDGLAPLPRSAEATKPAGIVTFLFTEPLWSAADAARAVIGRHGGFEVEAGGASFAVAFARARDAVAAAVAIQRTTTDDPRVAVGLDSAEAVPADGGYTGPGIRGAADLWSAANPGQILLSQATRDLLRETRFDEAGVVDLGYHRLRDLTAAQRVFQLAVAELDDEFPPLRSLASYATNLPLQPTPLVGREREIEELADLLRRPQTRIVSLTGTGGTGKTRLGLHAAAELLDDFPDGVFFVALAPLADPDLVLPTIAQTLGVPVRNGDALAAYVRDRQLLLVLDNFEHVIEAAPLVGAVAGSGSGTKVLVTTRAPLRLAGEQVYPVLPLETPEGHDDLERLLRCESVALFASRSRSVRSDFVITAANARAVAEVCKALEGLPLAIELAATRVAVLPPATMLVRLDDRLQLLKGGVRDAPERQRTMRATIDWSYDLLEPEQQQLLTRIAVFTGGFTLEAGESVCGAGLDVVDALASLTENGLVRLGGTDEEPRFTILETIRAYAAERLEGSGCAEDLRRRHSEHFLAFAEKAEPHLRGSPGDWLDRLEDEHDNFRSALDRLEASGESERRLRLAGALWRFWYLKGHLAEGSRRLESALLADSHPTAARAKALNGAAVMAVNLVDSGTAKLRAEEGMALHRTLGDRWGAAYAGFMLGNAHRLEGAETAARPLFEENARVFRDLGDEHSSLLVSRNLVNTYAALGDRRRARELSEDNLRRARATDNARIEASTLGVLATIALEEGRVAEAASMLKTSLRIHDRLGDVLDTAVDLARFAVVLARQGKGLTAARLLGSLGTALDDIGLRRATVDELSREALAIARERVDAAALDDAFEQGRTLTVPEAVTLALAA
jgi:predicted ATPase/DNA-binding SARP family transcriptional activator